MWRIQTAKVHPSRDRVKVVFPAANKVDRHTVADKFPYWYATLTSNGPSDKNEIKEKRLHQRLKDHGAPSFNKFMAPPADHNEAAEAPATRSRPINARPLASSNTCVDAPSDAIGTGTQPNAQHCWRRLMSRNLRRKLIRTLQSH